MSKTIEVRVPELGDYRDVPVIDVLVQEGEQVENETALITLESEKATMEVPSPTAGRVRGIAVRVGQKVSPGDVILSLEVEEGAAAASPPQAPPVTEAAPREPSPPPAAEATAASPSAPSPASAGALQDVRVPDLGDYHNVPVIEVLVSDGSAVTQDEPLVVLESEKATLEVPAPGAGVVRQLQVRVGDKVSKDDLLCRLEAAEGKPTQPAPPPTREAPVTTEAQADEEAREPLPPGGSGPAPSREDQATPARPERPQPPWTTQAGEPLAHASPAVRKFARELGVPLGRLQGSGPKGRILQQDVQDYVKRLAQGGAAGGMPVASPAVDFRQWGEIEHRPLGRIRRLSAQHLHRAWTSVPHVTQFGDADITELDAFRKAQAETSGEKLTLLPLIMKAVAAALRAYPEFNASLAPDGEQLIVKKYCHIGFAADTEHGLVVPVVRDVWGKGVLQLSQECRVLAQKARDGKLKAEEMKGGCFSISSLGGLGVTGGFTPIVNAPEVAILGVSRATLQPVWSGQAFEPRLMLPLSLSYDHRVIDGAYAARFLVHLVQLLGDLRRILL